MPLRMSMNVNVNPVFFVHQPATRNLFFQMAEVMSKSLHFVVQWTQGGTIVNRLVEVQSKHQVLAASKAAFSLEGGEYVIEAFLPAFDLFVRIDNPEALPDGGKLRLVKILATAASPSSLSTAETVPVLTLDVSSHDGTPSGSILDHDAPPIGICST